MGKKPSSPSPPLAQLGDTSPSISRLRGPGAPLPRKLTPAGDAMGGEGGGAMGAFFLFEAFH